MVPEGRGIFGQLTIEENLAMGGYSRKDPEGVKHDTEHVFELFPRLAERRRQSAGTLSGGEQQMLAMGRAMISRPRLLLLDEPSMGRSEEHTSELQSLMRISYAVFCLKKKTDNTTLTQYSIFHTLYRRVILILPAY